MRTSQAVEPAGRRRCVVHRSLPTGILLARQGISARVLLPTFAWFYGAPFMNKLSHSVRSIDEELSIAPAADAPSPCLLYLAAKPRMSCNACSAIRASCSRKSAAIL
jgi:hypothetical protein